MIDSAASAFNLDRFLCFHNFILGVPGQHLAPGSVLAKHPVELPPFSPARATFVMGS